MSIFTETSLEESLKDRERCAELLTITRNLINTIKETQLSPRGRFALSYFHKQVADLERALITSYSIREPYIRASALMLFRQTKHIFMEDEDGILSLIDFLKNNEPEERFLLTQPQQELIHPDTRIAILPYSPILTWLEKLLNGEIRFDTQNWRQFEEAVAELLQKDGYDVILGPGRKDGGRDLFASKEDPVLGFIASTWQAKMLAPGNKVAIGVVRELAGACFLNDTKTTKGIIVTTTYLTKDALLQVEQDRHILGKRDRNDLLLWIDQLKQRR